MHTVTAFFSEAPVSLLFLFLQWQYVHRHNMLAILQGPWTPRSWSRSLKPCFLGYLRRLSWKQHLWIMLGSWWHKGRLLCNVAITMKLPSRGFKNYPSLTAFWQGLKSFLFHFNFRLMLFNVGPPVFVYCIFLALLAFLMIYSTIYCFTLGYIYQIDSADLWLFLDKWAPECTDLIATDPVWPSWQLVVFSTLRGWKKSCFYRLLWALNVDAGSLNA